MIKFVFYIPKGEDEKIIEEIKDIFMKINIPYDIKFINKNEEQKLKFNVLIPIAVSKRIKIKQTKRTKSLYPQLVVFYKNKPLVFYPQSYGNKKIEIKEFLQGFLDKKSLCLYEIPELEQFNKIHKNEP